MPMTPEEIDIATVLGEVWNKFNALPAQHLMERDEFCQKIHDCQTIVLARSASREQGWVGVWYRQKAEEDKQ